MKLASVVLDNIFINGRKFPQMWRLQRVSTIVVKLLVLRKRSVNPKRLAGMYSLCSIFKSLLFSFYLALSSEITCCSYPLTAFIQSREDWRKWLPISMQATHTGIEFWHKQGASSYSVSILLYTCNISCVWSEPDADCQFSEINSIARFM